MKKLWILSLAVFILSFAILGYVGVEIFRQAPPIPSSVATSDGVEFIGPEQISDGQNVWQAMGGMQVGSIWGHGSYVAPDWTADYLHRESIFILNEWTGGRYGKDGSAVPNEERAAMQARLQALMRTPTRKQPADSYSILSASGPSNRILSIICRSLPRAARIT